MVSATHRGFGSFGRGKALVGVPLALAAGVLLSVASLPFASEAAAQASKAKAAKDAKSAAEAQRAAAAAGQQAYAAGVRSFEAGDIARAEQQLSAALAGGGLPNAQMARALYYRGSAYRQLGRPAQAISDLTTAVWLKGGLPPDLKTKAIEARKLAYQEAGIGDTPPPIGAGPMDQSPSTATAATPAAPSPGTQVVQVTEQSFWSGFSMPSLTGSPAAPATQTAAATGGEPQQQSSSFWSFLPSLGGSSEAQSAAEPAPPTAAGFATTTVAASDAAASAPAMGFGAVSETAQAAETSSWDTATAASAAASPAPAQTVVASYVPPPDAVGLTAPSTPPPAAPGGTSWNNPLAGTGQAVSGFFSNMFSPGAAPAETAPTAVTTGSTGATGWETTDGAGATSQTSSMLQRGPESPAASEPMPWATGSTGAAAAPARVATAAPGGHYKLQVAAVRSREEAERLAQSLSGYQPVRDGRVRPEIDETVIGSMGTFYRVRLGPYADSKEPGQLCATLKPQGFDCLVVTQ